MSQQYTNGFEFSATSGQATCVELPAPPRGAVRRVVLKQLNGALAGFAAELLDRQDACSGAAEISNSFEGDTPATENKLLDLEMHRIIAPISVAAVSAIYSAFDLDAGYQNRNEQDIRRTPDSRIYLDITPAGTGEKTFQIAYTVEPVAMA